MISLQCRSCGYKFEKDRTPLRCPYCSKEGSVGPMKTAQDWLDETTIDARNPEEDKKRRG